MLFFSASYLRVKFEFYLQMAFIYSVKNSKVFYNEYTAQLHSSEVEPLHSITEICS